MHRVVSQEARLDSNIAHKTSKSEWMKKNSSTFMVLYIKGDSRIIEVTLISGRNTHLELKNNHFWTSLFQKHRNEFPIISHSGSMSNQYSHWITSL